MNLPNVISLARLLSVPVNVWLIMVDAWLAAFVLFLAAGLSDAIDGFLARRFNARTLVGRYLDPLADKTMLVAVYIALGVANDLPLWLIILVVSRDLLIVGGALFLYTLNQKLNVTPLVISKVNTTGQIALAAVVLGTHALNLAGMQPIIDGLVLFVAVTTILSGGGYLRNWGRRMADIEG